jgi:SDR family mycofactocin-dependent oxidoreductase
VSARQIKNVSYDFRGQVVLVTGGARGQGRSHALAFAEAGADIVIADIGAAIESVLYPLATTEELNATAAEIEALHVRCLPAVCDVRDARQVEALVDDALAHFGRIDVLINNAGIESISSLVDMGEQQWDDVVDTCLRGAFLCSKYVVPNMIERRRGKIVSTGSTSSYVGVPRNAHYVAAKHGIMGLTKSLALELAEYGINVNAVCPGGMDTPMTAGMLASRDAEWLTGLGELTGIWNLFAPEAMLQPEEISHAMLWLSSDAADFVTGTSIMVDAGFTIK